MLLCRLNNTGFINNFNLCCLIGRGQSSLVYMNYFWPTAEITVVQGCAHHLGKSSQKCWDLKLTRQKCGERCPRLLDSLHSWCKGPVGEGAWHINRTEKLLGDKEQRARKRVKGEARAKPCKTLGFILRVMVLIPRERGVNESLDDLTWTYSSGCCVEKGLGRADSGEHEWTILGIQVRGGGSLD